MDFFDGVVVGFVFFEFYVLVVELFDGGKVVLCICIYGWLIDDVIVG